MTDGNSCTKTNDLSVLFNDGVIGSRTDSQLVEQFVAHDREAAELAFAVLVKRHGPMVLRTGRTIVGDEHMAEDVVQATFLVLAMKAKRLRVRGSLGPWLHSVARRVACSARSAAARRRRHERAASVPSGDLRPRLLPGGTRLSAPRGTRIGSRTAIVTLSSCVTWKASAARKRRPTQLAGGDGLESVGAGAKAVASMPDPSRNCTVVSPGDRKHTARPVFCASGIDPFHRSSSDSAGRLSPSEIVPKSVVTLVHGVLTAMTARVLRNVILAALLPLGGALIYLGSTHGASSKPPATVPEDARKSTNGFSRCLVRGCILTTICQMKEKTGSQSLS